MEDDIFFEIAQGLNFIRIEPLERINYNSDNFHDNNWIRSKVKVRGGAFLGEYNGEFLTSDFSNFHKQFAKLYDDLSGVAWLKDLERYLDLQISGDGIGHFEVVVIACDKPGVDESTLTYSLFFDQTEIKRMVRQLDIILQEFPVIGQHR